MRHVGAFRVQAKACMSADEVTDAINMIAADPTCGAMLKETGGIRKVRFAIEGRGKSGGCLSSTPIRSIQRSGARSEPTSRGHYGSCCGSTRRV
jgi:hypothetical protein